MSGCRSASCAARTLSSTSRRIDPPTADTTPRKMAGISGSRVHDDLWAAEAEIGGARLRGLAGEDAIRRRRDDVLHHLRLTRGDGDIVPDTEYIFSDRAADAR